MGAAGRTLVFGTSALSVRNHAAAADGLIPSRASSSAAPAPGVSGTEFDRGGRLMSIERVEFGRVGAPSPLASEPPLLEPRDGFAALRRLGLLERALGRRGTAICRGLLCAQIVAAQTEADFLLLGYESLNDARRTPIAS